MGHVAQVGPERGEGRQVAALVEPLTELRDRLKEVARERGWEVK